MIIIVKGANFSANNIGQVDVPIAYDADARAYLDAIPATDAILSEDKKKAINSYFKSLKSGGLFSKINHLYLPIFGRVDGSVNLKNPLINLGLPSSGATYDAQGVLFTTGWVAIPISVSMRESLGGIYNTTQVVATGTTPASAFGYTGGSGYFKRKGSSNFSNMILTATNRVDGLAGSAAFTGLLAGSFSFTGNYMVGTDGTNVMSDATVLASEVPDSTINPTIGSLQSLSEPLNAKIGLIVFGSPFTAIELEAYRSLTATLMAALLA